MKKKILAITLCVAMLAVMLVSGTLAYFTDTEEATNVFTVGKVDVELIESFYHRESAYMDENLPEGYDQYAAGTVVEDKVIEASGKVYADYLASKTLMPGTQINKMPYVKNTGNTNAYVRIRVMLPKDMDADFLNTSVLCTTATSSGEFTGPVAYIGTTVNGEVEGEYAVYEFTRVEPLTPNEMTYWNVWNTIRMDPEVTNQDLEVLITKGVIEDMTFGVKIEVDAIQADGFKNATEAWDAFDAQTSNSVSTEEYSANAKDGYITEEVGG